MDNILHSDLRDCQWYDPNTKEYNTKRKSNYYVGIIINDKFDSIHEFDSWIDAIQYIPVFYKDNVFVIKRNDDFTETLLFKWNNKYKKWFNCHHFKQKIV